MLISFQWYSLYFYHQLVIGKTLSYHVSKLLLSGKTFVNLKKLSRRFAACYRVPSNSAANFFTSAVDVRNCPLPLTAIHLYTITACFYNQITLGQFITLILSDIGLFVWYCWVSVYSAHGRTDDGLKPMWFYSLRAACTLCLSVRHRGRFNRQPCR